LQRTDKALPFGNALKIEGGMYMKCPGCEAVISKGLRTCPECGYDFVREKENAAVHDASEEAKRQQPLCPHSLPTSNRIKNMLILAGIGIVILAIVLGLAVSSRNRHSGKQEEGKESGTEFPGFFALKRRRASIPPPGYWLMKKKKFCVRLLAS
jgi:hypothetical protein